METCLLTMENAQRQIRDPDVTPTDDFKIKEIQSFEKYMATALLPTVKTDISTEQLADWLSQTDPADP